MNKIKILICLLFVSTSLLAQEINIPKDLKFETAQDFKNTEPLVLRATEWLIKTPVSETPTNEKKSMLF